MKTEKSPQLETARLILRPYRMSDATDIARHLKDRAVTRYTYIPHPYMIGDFYQFMRRIRSPKARAHNIVFAIVDKSSGKAIGAVGVHGIDFKNRKTEIGYWLAKSYWGKGIVVEAVNRVVEYLFLERRLQRVFARVWHPNTKSARVLEKAGFTLEGRLRRDTFRNRRWMDVLLFGILIEEWRHKRRSGTKL
jgi:RimJ/RimL family protein N-acetyltransferase